MSKPVPVLRAIGRLAVATTLGMTSLVAGTASAAAPDLVEQLEPAVGEWQVQYAVQLLGGGDEQSQEIEFYRGITRHIALGIELEAGHSGGKIILEEVGFAALVRLTDEDDPYAIGMIVKIALDTGAALSELETLVLLGKEGRGWRGQANAIARLTRDDGEVDRQLGYAWSLEHRFGRSFWLGMEGSGRLLRNCRGECREGSRHAAGPTITFDHERAAGDVEIRLAYLHGLAGKLRTGSLHVLTQVTF